MNVFILSSYHHHEGVEEHRTLGTYRTLKRAMQAAAEHEEASARKMFNTPTYFIEDWFFPDTYLPPEQKEWERVK